MPITVNYKTDDGTATTGDLDYEDNDGNLIFNSPEALTKTSAVIVNGDNKFEANETFSVTLNNATNATIDPPTKVRASFSMMIVMTLIPLQH